MGVQPGVQAGAWPLGLEATAGAPPPLPSGPNTASR